MTHDTDPTPAGETTEPDGEAVLARPDAAVTDPGMPPIAHVDTDVDGTSPAIDRPVLAYTADIEDPEVASLLGNIAPARVAPPVGDTRETSGQDAAAGRISLRRPPKATETPTPEAAVVVEATTSPLPLPAVVLEPRQPPRQSTSTTVPRARAARPMMPLVLLALAGGVALTTIVVLLAIRGERDTPAPSTSASAPASSNESPAKSPAAESPTPSSSALAAPVAPSTSSPPPPVRPPAHEVKASPTPTGGRNVRPSVSSIPTASPPPSSKTAPATAPSATALPSDIKWTL